MTLEMKELESAVESILFASGEPVHIDRICIALELDRLSAEQILQRLFSMRQTPRGQEMPMFLYATLREDSIITRTS